MGIAIKRLTGEPILLVTMMGHVANQDMRELVIQSVRLSHGVPGPIYRITDVRSITGTFGEVLGMFKSIEQKDDEARTEFRFMTIFVAHETVARLYHHKMPRKVFGQDYVPFFTNFEEALAYTRLQVLKINPPQDILSDLSS